MKKKIKNKLMNHIMLGGNKAIIENVVFKTIKKLQKNSNKQLKQIIKISIINSTSTFKMHKIKNKKTKKKKIIEIPAFISKSISRTSLAIKLILENVKKKKSKKIYNELTQKIILTTDCKGNAVEIKNNLQQQVILKKHFFNYYRWK
jgi:ribosomal protein S7